MGWTYPYGVNRKQLISQRTEAWERTNGDILIKTSCLKHCYRGGVFAGVLWTVWQRMFIRDGIEAQPEERYIGCDLLHCHKGEWGYKDMEESMHPYYYSCPLGYLKVVPIDRFGGNAEWRVQVVQQHQRQAKKRQRLKIV